jgi:hypothetical protein
MVEMPTAYTILTGKFGGKRPLGKPRCRWENNVKIDLKAAGWGEWTVS